MEFKRASTLSSTPDVFWYWLSVDVNDVADREILMNKVFTTLFSDGNNLYAKLALATLDVEFLQIPRLLGGVKSVSCDSEAPRWVQLSTLVGVECFKVCLSNDNINFHFIGANSKTIKLPLDQDRSDDIIAAINEYRHRINYPRTW